MVGVHKLLSQQGSVALTIDPMDRLLDGKWERQATYFNTLMEASAKFNCF